MASLTMLITGHDSITVCEVRFPEPPRPSNSLRSPTEGLRVRAEISSHSAAGPQARWRGASDDAYPGRYVRSEQQSQRACGPQPEGARSPGRRSAQLSENKGQNCLPTRAPECEVISARALKHPENCLRPGRPHEQE